MQWQPPLTTQEALEAVEATDSRAGLCMGYFRVSMASLPGPNGTGELSTDLIPIESCSQPLALALSPLEHLPMTGVSGPLSCAAWAASTVPPEIGHSTPHPNSRDVWA